MLPREKAINYGIQSLNNTELLALIIKSGNKENSVFDIADNVIKSANGFNNLLSLTYEELIQIKGIKKAKALELLAILEIFKRLTNITCIKQDEFHSPEKVVDYVRYKIGFSNQEEFLVIYLNNAGRILKSEIIFRGSKNCSIVGVDEVFRKAILLKASNFIVCHNHPGGKCVPSQEDINITEQLKKAGRMMSINLIDHIIVSKESYYSFKLANLL